MFSYIIRQNLYSVPVLQLLGNIFIAMVTTVVRAIVTSVSFNYKQSLLLKTLTLYIMARVQDLQYM